MTTANLIAPETDQIILSWSKRGIDTLERKAAEKIISAILIYRFSTQQPSSQQKAEQFIADVNNACADIDGVPDNFGENVLSFLSSSVFKGGKRSAARDFLVNQEIDLMIRKFIATSQLRAGAGEEKAASRQAREIARKIKSAFGIDYSKELKQRELSIRFRALSQRIELLSKSSGIHPARKEVLGKMVIALRNFEISENQIAFAKDFNQHRWALPEHLQIEVSKMVGYLKEITPAENGIIGHRATENVSSLTALWDAAWLGLAKFKMKAICATYGKYLDSRISHYQKKIAQSGSPDGLAEKRVQEIDGYKQRIENYKKQFNKYSYFNYEISKYAKIERQINQLSIQIARLSLRDEKKKISLQANLLDLRNKLERVKQRTLQSGTAEPIAYSDDLINFVQAQPSTIEKISIFNTGHAGNLIAIPGKDQKPVLVITDPMFDDAHKTYPAETQIPVIAAGELYIPAVDYIFISHNHMDHVSPNSIKMLLEKNPGLHVIVPGGCTNEFIQYGVSADRIIAACQWGMTIPLDSTATMQITPAVHWSGSPRENAGINMSGVMSCVITSSTSKEDVFYAGDTANFAPVLRQEIDSALNPEHSAIYLLPSGPNFPNKHMKSTHQNTAAQSYFALSSAAAAEQRWEHLAASLEINAFIDAAASLEPLVLPFKTMLTHHNQIHFGEDRYNETLYIHCKQMILLNKQLSPAQLREMAKLDRGNSFIYLETAELLEKIHTLYSDSPQQMVNVHLAAANYMLNHIQSPVIGGKMLSSTGEVCAANVAALKQQMHQAAYEFSRVLAN